MTGSSVVKASAHLSPFDTKNPIRFRVVVSGRIKSAKFILHQQQNPPLGFHQNKSPSLGDGNASHKRTVFKGPDIDINVDMRFCNYRGIIPRGWSVLPLMKISLRPVPRNCIRRFG